MQALDKFYEWNKTNTRMPPHKAFMTAGICGVATVFIWLGWLQILKRTGPMPLAIVFGVPGIAMLATYGYTNRLMERSANASKNTI